MASFVSGCFKAWLLGCGIPMGTKYNLVEVLEKPALSLSGVCRSQEESAIISERFQKNQNPRPLGWTKVQASGHTSSWP
eukprot:s37_g30.t1